MVTVKSISEEIWKSKSPIIELPEEVLKIISKDKKIKKLDALEISAKYLHGVETFLKKKIDDCVDKGTTPKFKFSLSASRLIRDSDTALIEKKEKILKELKKITWKKFEDTFRGYLTFTGVKDVGTIGPVKEGGVDFYGVLYLDCYEITNPLMKRIKLRIVGQAKHRKNKKVTEEEARVFASHLEDLKNERGLAWDKLPEDKFKKLKYPIISIFVTNSEFTGGAQKKLEEKGVIIVYGEQLAEWLAKHFV